jgi:hypothetical protein
MNIVNERIAALPRVPWLHRGEVVRATSWTNYHLDNLEAAGFVRTRQWKTGAWKKYRREDVLEQLKIEEGLDDEETDKQN